MCCFGRFYYKCLAHCLLRKDNGAQIKALYFSLRFFFMVIIIFKVEFFDIQSCSHKTGEQELVLRLISATTKQKTF